MSSRMLYGPGGRYWPLVVLLTMVMWCVSDGHTTPRPTGITLLPILRSTTPSVKRSTPGGTGTGVFPVFTTSPPPHNTGPRVSVTGYPPRTGYPRQTTPGARPVYPTSTIRGLPITTQGAPPFITTPNKIQPHFTDAPGDGGNLTGSDICVRQVTETRYAWQTVTFACHRTTVVPCFLCPRLLNCQYFNTSHCEKKEPGTCSATVYQYQPVEVSIRECCKGFEQQGNRCVKIKACENGNGGCSQLCRKKEGGQLYCECFNGYLLHGTSCVDWDECLASNGGCSHTCTNSLGSFYCTCPVGYALISPSQCEEVDECKLYNGGCAQKCVNTEGRHYCECAEGYRLANGTDCQDKNECEDEYICDHKCHNFAGTYLCTCPEGQQLQPDKRSCSGSGPVKTARTDAEVLTSVPMIATLASVGALVIIVLMIWVICCYLKGPCWCCASNSSPNSKPRHRQDESIVMQYRGSGEGKNKQPPPYNYDNGAYVSGGSDSSDYTTNARRPNGLPDKEVVMEDDIHILSD